MKPPKSPIVSECCKAHMSHGHVWFEDSVRTTSYCMKCSKECQAVSDEAEEQKQPKRCSCGGTIETHQGNNGFPDEWYCLECGKDFKTNPFKQKQPKSECLASLRLISCPCLNCRRIIPKESANDLLDNWKNKLKKWQQKYGYAGDGELQTLIQELLEEQKNL